MLLLFPREKEEAAGRRAGLPAVTVHGYGYGEGHAWVLHWIDGECVYTSPKTMDIRKQCLAEQDTLWEESRRLVNPHQVYVDLSRKLYDTKLRLLDEVGEKHQGIQS